MNASDTEEVEALVVGSGVSGATTAFRLYHAGVRDVLCTEARDVVGGNLVSRNADGYLWEEGPNTFQPTSTILQLAADLDMVEDVVLADHRLPRYVYWDGTLNALPLSPGDLLGEFRLLSWPGKLRAALGALGLVPPLPSGVQVEEWHDGQLRRVPLTPENESVEEFVTRHLGREVFLKLIDPFVSGVYAGDPKRLAMAAAFKRVFALQQLGGTPGILEGALIRIGQLRRERGRQQQEQAADARLPSIRPGALGSFRHGLQQLPLTVQQVLGEQRLRTRYRLVSLRYDASRIGRRPFTATYDTPTGTRTVRAEAVALTVPAAAAATILQSAGLSAARRLADIRSPPVYSVTLAYPRDAFHTPLNGFGNLIPRSMGIRTLGMIWSSCLFPYRAPESMHMVLAYIGGAQDEAIRDMTPEAVVQQVHADVRRVLLKEEAPAPRVLGVRLWPHAIPQYERGHLQTMRELDAALADMPGLYVGGNYRSGVSFGDCVQWGTDNAARMREYLQRCRAAGTVAMKAETTGTA